MTSTNEANLAAALALAGAGAKIFPAGADKRPLFKAWQEIATADADQVRAWWERAPHAIPAIPCGTNNIVVLDLDRHPGAADGVLAFKELVAQHGALPSTVPIVKTPNGGGLHLYFKQPDGEPLGNGRGELPAGIDVRGAGGFVIGPGAVLPDGRGWTPVNGRPSVLEFLRNGAASIPEWAQNIIRGPASDDTDEGTEGADATDDERGRAYAVAALQEIEAELAGTTPGERNERLYKAAFRLGTMAARGWLDEAEIVSALMRASEANRYLREHGTAATKKTIESGLRDGDGAPHPDLDDRDEYQPQQERQQARSGGERKDTSGKAGPRQQRRQQRQQTGDWDEPDVSIQDDRRGDLPEFPAEALGSWREWLYRSARGAGVTASHVATPMLAAAASMIGTGRRIQPSRSWSEPLSLWTAVVGFSGTGKTPGADVVLRALSMIERNRKAEIAAMQLAHETKAEAAKAAKKRWEKEVQDAGESGSPFPPKPAAAMDVGKFIVPRLFASNVTVERWAALLQARPAGMLMYRDELAGHFLNMSRYTNGQDNEFWLEAFNGKHYVVERQSAPAIVIPHLLIGITGGIQPSKVARCFEGDDDGMYTRVVFSWPSASAYQPLTDDVSEMEPELVNALTRLANLPCTDGEGNLAPQTVPLSDEARREFEQYRQFVHSGLDALDGREREWWAKGPTHVLRLSGTLAYLDWASAGGPEPSEIEAQFVHNAVRLWRDYFWHHACAALRQVGITEKHADARRVLRWIKANKRTEVAREDLRREALKQRLDAEQTQAVIDLLVKAGWFRERTVVTPGRHAKRWDVNPKLYS